jgi:hypothetical protein
MVVFSQMVSDVQIGLKSPAGKAAQGFKRLLEPNNRYFKKNHLLSRAQESVLYHRDAIWRAI